MNKDVDILTDLNGNNIVVINDIRFKGKRNVDWREVEKYLKKYVGDFCEITETKDIIYIGSDLPDEYTNSNYTHILKGAYAKAKANATQGLLEMIKTAKNKSYQENKKDKHNKNALFGWYRYKSRFALPVFDEKGEMSRYNIFTVVIVVRHDKNGKMYMYDIVDIKKETSKLFQSKDLTQ